ncbi:MAG: Hpt domain-containing protein [Thermoanaerobaculia bacterium]
MQTAQTLEGRLANLTRRYLDAVPDRIAAIGETLMHCQRESIDAATFLGRQFHTLAGTAGTYGLLAVSAVAVEAEETCAAIEGRPIDDESFTYLKFLVGHLRALTGDREHPFTLIAGGNAATVKGNAVA